MTEQRNSISNILPAVIPPTNLRKSAQIEWLEAADGAKLGCRIWRGNEDAPVVIYLHGIEGHSQWFENTAAVLNENGITVYAPDRRGAGMNGGMRGHLDNYKVLLSDLESQTRYIKREHRGQRLIMIANCWSAKLAALFAQSNYESTNKTLVTPLAGLILIAPAIYTRIDFSLITKLEIAMEYMLGGRYRLKYWPIPITTAMLTKNPIFAEFLEKDSLRITKATTSFFVQTFFLTKKAQQSAKFIKIPVLVLQGQDDLIVNTNKLEGWYQQITSKDKSIHNFPGAAHSLDFDAEWFKEYTHELTNWIMTRGQLGV